MDIGTPKYAKKIILDRWWYLKYQEREDGSVQILGHWGASGSDPEPENAEAITTTFRLEEDGARFVGRVWLKDGGSMGAYSGIPAGSTVHVVANPQHVFSYKER